MTEIYWDAIFQTFTLITIFIVLFQIKVSDRLDLIRNHDTTRWLFYARRTAMFAKLIALMWTVIYSYNNAWQAWPPIVLFLAAFDIRVLMDILVMRSDIGRITRMYGLERHAVM